MSAWDDRAALERDWLVDEHAPGDIHLFRRLETRVALQSPYQRIEIARLEPLGWCLILDGKLQSAELDERLYHELLVHPALLAHPRPQRVLILGAGEGATLREVLRHPSVVEVTAVDIDQAVVEVCRAHLPTWHAGAFDDPRVRLVIGDAEAFLREEASEAGYDVVIGDLTDPGDVGPARQLYARHFFELIARRLAVGGIYVSQCGEVRHHAAEAHGQRIIRLLREVFPAVLPYAEYIPSFDAIWLFALAGGLRPGGIPVATIGRRAQARGLQLQHYGPAEHQRAFSYPFLARWAADAADAEGRRAQSSRTK